MKLEVVKQHITAKTRTLSANWTIVFEDDMTDKKLTWRDHLTRVRGSHFGNHAANYEKPTERMKEKYPGNYIIEEYYNSKTHTFDLRLKFDTPEDETWFLLRNE